MAEQGFTLSSPAFKNGASIPPQYSCDGENASPELNWIHPPTGTQSYGLIVDDPDAPNGTFTHWVLFDIPGDRRGLAKNSKGVGRNGRNDFQYDHWGGPCPPPNHPAHRYVFTLYALDIASLNLEPGVRRDEVERAMRDHILGQTQLMGTFSRSTGTSAKP